MKTWKQYLWLLCGYYTAVFYRNSYGSQTCTAVLLFRCVSVSVPSLFLFLYPDLCLTSQTHTHINTHLLHLRWPSYHGISEETHCKLQRSEKSDAWMACHWRICFFNSLKTCPIWANWIQFTFSLPEPLTGSSRSSVYLENCITIKHLMFWIQQSRSLQYSLYLVVHKKLVQNPSTTVNSLGPMLFPQGLSSSHKLLYSVFHYSPLVVSVFA